MILSVLDVAKFIINYCYDNMSPISTLRLQKILYYAQGISYIVCKQPCFKEDLYAWKYGPVNKETYYEYKGYGYLEISKQEDISLEKKQEELIIDLLNKAKNKSTWSLIEETHKEDPWKNVYSEIIRDKMITKESIKSFFTNNRQNHWLILQYESR